MRVRYLGAFAKPTGYGTACHDDLAALHKAGLDLDIVPIIDCDTDELSPRYRHLIPLCHREDFDPTHIVVRTIPRYAHEFVIGDLEPKSHVKKVCATTWETNHLPADIAKLLTEHFDLIVVPSLFNRCVFVESGIPQSKVAVIPHCYEPDFWPMFFGPVSTAPFTFYSILVWAERKHPLGLLKAYLTEFSSEDNCVLKFVAPFVPLDEVSNLIEGIGLPETTLPTFEFLGDPRLTDDRLLELHRESHCYVSATRGEAWGLGAFEAAIMGNQVIMPRFGGQMDFLRIYSAFRSIPHQLTPAIAELSRAKAINLGGVNVTPVVRAAPTGITGKQDWAEPDLIALKREMRLAYSERETFTKTFSPELAANFSYDVVGPKFKHLLESL